VLCALHFAGEEQGMWGYRRYVERHRAELDNFAATLTFDTGSGRLMASFSTPRRPQAVR